MSDNNSDTTVSIREAKRQDAGAMMELIRELAIFEREPDAVTVSNETFVESGFGGSPVWQALVAEKDNRIIGIGLYYIRYSTWKGPYMYIEDLIVTQESRNLGIGEQLINRLISLAREKKYSKIGWQVLNWNEDAIRFYRKIKGIEFDNGWTNCTVPL